jgi:hypothetical protein
MQTPRRHPARMHRPVRPRRELRAGSVKDAACLAEAGSTPFKALRVIDLPSMKGSPLYCPRAATPNRGPPVDATDRHIISLPLQ